MKLGAVWMGALEHSASVLLPKLVTGVYCKEEI